MTAAQTEVKMNSKKKDARIAGFWYLLVAITGGFGIMYVPLNIVVAGDAAATARNIIDSGWIYRLSIVSNLVCQVCFVYLALALSRLLKQVSEGQARLMVTLVTAAVPVAFLNTLNLIAAQLLVGGNDYLKAFEADQLNALALTALYLYDQGMLIVQIFWGLWLLPFGILVYRSTYIPRTLGVLLMINCFAYLLLACTRLLDLPWVDLVSTVSMPFQAIGEFAIILWLLIIGVTERTGGGVRW
jgi:hypothetical protein